LIAGGPALAVPLGAVAAARPFEWGALVNYLTVPKVMLETGRYPDLRGAPFFFPELAEASFVLILAPLYLPVIPQALPIAGPMAFPWCLDPCVRMGNPVYPFLFGGVGWGPDLFRLLSLAASPLELSTLATAGTLSYDLTLRVVWLATFPALLVRHQAGDDGARARGRFVAGGFTPRVSPGLFSANLMQGRSILFLLVVAAVFWARAIDLSEFQFFLRETVAIVAAVNLISLWGGILAGPLPAGGLEPSSAADFYDWTLGSDYWAVSAAYAPGAAPALFLWEPRAYFCLPDDLLDLWRTSGLDPVAARAASGLPDGPGELAGL